MIEYILLKDCQVHHKKHIVFTPGVNVLVGDNDTGKSTILRGLEWILTNTPSGNDLISWGTKRVYAELGLDGNILKRIKGQDNLYILNGQKFRAFGTKVPEQIAKLANTHTASFQNQHDSLYWISQSPGQISKALNEIVDLATIDNSLHYIHSEARKAKQTELITHSRRNAAKQRKQELIWVTELDSDVTELEKLEQRLKQLLKKRLRLSQLTKTGVKLTRKVERAVKRLPALLKGLEQLKQYEIKHSVKAAKLKVLRNLIWQIQNLEANTELRKGNLAQLEAQIEGVKNQFQTCPVCGKAL